MLRKAGVAGLGALSAGAAGVAYVYRPQPWVRPPRDPLSENAADEEDNFLMKTARLCTFVGGTVAYSFLMHVMNKFELKEDEHYTAFLEAVKERPPGVPLLTVSNHCSPLDDPAVLVGMLPPSLTMRPERMRWTICAQEICFKWAAAAAALGSAKVMPIARGEGIDQRQLLNYYRRLSAGGWCHIFPEGHCEQDGSLGGRAAGPSRDKHGRLKWGVGKLIAHAAVPPVVIPIYHTGMANLMPLNPFTRKILNAIPRTGHTVTARAGGAIKFDDLIESHVKLHGPLRKLEPVKEPANIESSSSPLSFSLSVEGERAIEEGGEAAVGDRGGRVELVKGEEGDKVWRSTAAERQLYSKIARRIEDALLDLEAETRRDLGDAYPGYPQESAAMLRIVGLLEDDGTSGGERNGGGNSRPT